MSEFTDADTASSQAAFSPPAPEELERLLPNYAITQLIAFGGMGAVYGGMQRGLDRPVAIKILPPDAGRDQESLDRFRTEAKAMARLTHPNIPAVYDFAVVEEFCVLVMELVEGPNVFTLIRDKALQPPHALEILAQVCDAVHFAHSRGIIHGDIKPGNMLINQDGVVKLADFGLARLMEHGDRASDSWTPMGTPEYAAPELYDKNATPDHRADIYSLGVVLHEMLTGSPPVGEFDLPAEALGLDPRVDDIIARCMEFNPAARYQSAQEVRALLREIIEGRNVPVRQPAKSAARRIFKAPRRNPAAARRRGPALPAAGPPTGAVGRKSQPAPQPVAEVRPGAGKAPAPGARKTPPRRRVKKVVVVESGAARGMSDDAKRNLLIGAAIVVIAVAGWLLFSRSTPPPPVEEADKSKPAGKTSLPDTPSEIIPSPPSTPSKTTAATETRTTPPPPEPKAPPPPVPKTEPKPADPAEAPTAAHAKIHELRITYRDEWQSKVESKVSDEMTRLSGLYRKALQGLEDKYLGSGDAAAVLAVRNEVQRFETTGEPARGETVSSNQEIAKFQQSLAAQIDKLRTGVKYDADQVKEKYLLALKTLEREMDDKGDAAGSKAADAEFQKAAALSDTSLRDYFNRE